MANLVRVCPECRTLNQPEASFCRECRAELDAVRPVPVSSLPAYAREVGRLDMEPAPGAAPPLAQYVVLSGLNIPFWDLVWVLVKIALASIPAATILFFVGAMLATVLAGIGGGL